MGLNAVKNLRAWFRLPRRVAWLEFWRDSHDRRLDSIEDEMADLAAKVLTVEQQIAALTQIVIRKPRRTTK